MFFMWITRSRFLPFSLSKMPAFGTENLFSETKLNKCTACWRFARFSGFSRVTWVRRCDRHSPITPSRSHTKRLVAMLAVELVKIPVLKSLCWKENRFASWIHKSLKVYWNSLRVVNVRGEEEYCQRYRKLVDIFFFDFDNHTMQNHDCTLLVELKILFSRTLFREKA